MLLFEGLGISFGILEPFWGIFAAFQKITECFQALFYVFKQFDFFSGQYKNGTEVVKLKWGQQGNVGETEKKRGKVRGKYGKVPRNTGRNVEEQGEN